MILASCPRCSESIRFPEVELPGDAQARCPWCQEIFSAREVSAQLPPMVELFDGAGLPIDSMAFAATGVSLTSESAFAAGASSASHFDLEVPDAGEADRDDISGYDEVEAFDDVSEVDDDTTPGEPDPSAETWTDDGEPTQHHFANDNTHVLEAAPENADDFLVEGLEDDASTENVRSSEFRIEEDGPSKVDGYESISDEPIGFDSADQPWRRADARAIKVPGRGKGSNLKTLLGIALGPILALPIAGVIFYLLGTDLGFWPLDGGRSKSANVRASQPMDLDHFDPRPAADNASTRTADNGQTSDADLLPGATTVTSTPSGDSLASDGGGNNRTTDDNDVSLDRSFWAPPELAEEDSFSSSTGGADSKDKSDNETPWGNPRNESVNIVTPGIPLELPTDMKLKPDDSVPSNAKAVEKPVPKKKKAASIASEPAIVASKPPVDTALAEAVDQAKKNLDNLNALSQDVE